jgi:flagellin
MNAQRAMRKTRQDIGQNFARLSSGSRINKSADDAAGLAISEKLKAQIRGLRQARRNANDGISMIQVAEGALQETGNMLIRLRELAVQSASDTVGPTERRFTNKEFQQLKMEIERIAQGTNFNGTSLLRGEGGLLDIQVGTGNDPFQDRITYDTSSAIATLVGLNLEAEDISTKVGAQTSLAVLDDAITRVNDYRSTMGAMQNRLQSTVNNLAISEENLSAANSRIRDTDIAHESSELTKNNILQQAGIAVLSQANQSDMMALKLLG